MRVYVLIAEYGEYESFTQAILGVFTSDDAARAAIPEFEHLGRERSEAFNAYATKRDEYLAANFQPDRVIPPDSPFHDGCILYKNENYAEADAACGPRPIGVPRGDKYVIESYELGSANYEGGEPSMVIIP